MGFEDRYEIDCSVCGVLKFEPRLIDALVMARIYAKRCGQVTVYDRMAHKGAPQLWDSNGRLIAWREEEA